MRKISAGMERDMSEKLYDFAVIGGDMRQAYVAEELEKKGYRVGRYATAKVNTSLSHEAVSFDTAGSLRELVMLSRNIIGPVPFSKNKKYLFAESMRIDLIPLNLSDALEEGQIFMAGAIPMGFKELLKKKNICCIDLMKNEELTWFNTIATAEGAIAEAISNKGTNIHSSKCLVMGFGRCAKTLALKLKGINANVCIAARSEEAKSQAQAFGFEVIGFTNLNKYLDMFDYIFNTVPDKVLLKQELDKVKKNVLIIDIASAPGGVDFEAAKELNINARLCLGLPGIYSPYESSKALVRAIICELNLLENYKDMTESEGVNC